MHLSCNQTLAWQKLKNLSNHINKITLAELFKQSQQQQLNRFADNSIVIGDLLVDFSRQKIDAPIKHNLLELAKELDLEAKIRDLQDNKIVNQTEKRSAGHILLRKKNPDKSTQIIREKIESLANLIRSGKFKGATGKLITDVISVGIGGSDLGPKLFSQALSQIKDRSNTAPAVHYLSNCDSYTVRHLLTKLDPRTTLVIINSKTFTTLETLANANIIKHWLLESSPDAFTHQVIGVTANPEAARGYGIEANKILNFSQNIGGRYSVWSAVNFAGILEFGYEIYEQFLAGAAQIDEHFFNQRLSQNLPVLLGLIDIWNINFLNYHTLAIIPYADRLELLPDYLQQLVMESNGKGVDVTGKNITWQTAPIIWGGVGCNVQHSFMQMLHQGPIIVPIDFILPLPEMVEYPEQDQILVASCLGQAKSLMEGNSLSHIEEESNYLASHKHCPGNRPSSMFVFRNGLNPFALGQLLALWEHRVYVQSAIWGINCFDQWGVDLGKKTTKNLFNKISNFSDISNLDPSTQGIIKFCLILR